VREKIFVALVRFLGVAHAGILAHCPQAAPIHGGLNAARKRKLSRITRIGLIVPAFKIGRSIERMRRDVFQLLGVAFEFCVLRHV